MKSPAATTEKSSPYSTQRSSHSTQQPKSPAKIDYRAHNGYDVKAASDEATIRAEEYGESLTIQAHAEDADINVLMKRFGITGKMPENPEQLTQAMWGVDLTQHPIKDYRAAVEAVTRAHEGFMQFPAEIRARFDNDPGKFISWVNNPENAEEARKFGLVKPKPPEWKPAPDTQAIIEALKPLSEQKPAAK